MDGLVAVLRHNKAYQSKLPVNPNSTAERSWDALDVLTITTYDTTKRSFSALPGTASREIVMGEVNMKEIDITTWNRREHFLFFSNADLPFYNTCFNVDITRLKKRAKELNLSLNSSLIYVTIKALSRVDNFLLRYEQGKVLKYDDLIPSFAHMREGEELFRFITVKFNEDIRVFCQTVKDEIERSTKYFDLEELKNGTNFVFISSLPWIPFTGIDHTQSLNKYDTIPRITWGKYFTEGDRIMLPYNIQVNHIFIDGWHVGKFYESLNEEIGML